MVATPGGNAAVPSCLARSPGWFHGGSTVVRGGFVREFVQGTRTGGEEVCPGVASILLAFHFL